MRKDKDARRGSPPSTSPSFFSSFSPSVSPSLSPSSTEAGQSQTKGEGGNINYGDLKKDLESDLRNFLIEKIDKERSKTIEALGIFVTLFTFISINISIFSRVSDMWSAGIFSFLIFCSLCGMIILLDMLLNKDNSIRNFALFFILGVFILGAIGFLRGYTLNPVPGTIEFENAVNRRIDEKINNLINSSSKDFYTKSEIDGFLNKLKK